MNETLSDQTDTIRIEVSSRGKRLRSPITVDVPRAERPGEKALQNYVIDAFSKKMPILIKYTFDNQTVLNIAKYLLRHKTGSHQTLYQYVYGAYRFTETINETPDQLISRCKTNEGYQDQKQR